MGEGKVVELGKFRERRGIVSEQVAEVMNAGPFRSFILADGTVELVVEGDLEDGTPIVVSVFITDENMTELVRGLLNTSHQQGLRLKRLRSADRWIVKPHPTSPTSRLVTFDDIQRPFHRVNAGKRSGAARANENIGVCGSRSTDRLR